MLLANLLTGLVYLLGASTVTRTLPNIPEWAIFLLALLGSANSGFALAIWKWKRWGVYGFVASALVAFVVNVLILGIAAGILGLLGLFINVLILYFLLRSVWSTMESSRFDQWAFSSPQRAALVVSLFVVLLTVGGLSAHLGLGVHSLDPAAAQQADARGHTEPASHGVDQEIADYTEAIAYDPNNAKYYLDRGNAYDIEYGVKKRQGQNDKGSLDQAIAD